MAYLKPHHRLTGSFLAPIPHARELMRDPLDAKGCFMRWEAMPLPPHATPLLFDAMHALRMSMNGLAQELGSSRMTGQRWGSGRAHPSDAQIHTLARKVYPVDAALASKLAAAVGKTLPALGLVPAPAAPAVRDRVVDAVVCAAAEAVDMTPGAIRPALAAAFAAASELGLTVDAVNSVLTRKVSLAKGSRGKGG